MKTLSLIIILIALSTSLLPGQHRLSEKDSKAIAILIDQYSQARENRDTVLLKTILTEDVDQLVSTGEWRNGIASSIRGMLNSSASTPGTRTLTIEKLRLLSPASAIVDCKYEIKNDDGTTRKMWSSFLVVKAGQQWKISAIRNMLPTAP